jgi:hypothetical protein
MARPWSNEECDEVTKFGDVALANLAAEKQIKLYWATQTGHQLAIINLGTAP